MQTKHYIWLAAAVGIIIGVALWFLLAPKTAVAPATSTTASTTTTDLGGGVQIQTTGDVTVKEVPNDSIPAPALRTINFSAETSADLKTALQSQYNKLAPQIKTAPTRVDLWLQLGALYKIGGDYPGAIGAWSYVSKTGSSPSNYVAYGNLGDLYLNFTHEYQKAEASYKAALKLEPSNTDYQAGLKASQQAQGN